MGIVNSKDRDSSEMEDTKNITSVNQRDVELIKANWGDIKNKEEVGISIMVRIFQEHKEIKNKWIFATNLETEAEMISNSQLRYHAKKIMDIIGKVVNKLLSTSNPSEFSIDELDLTRLGRNHFHYGVNRDHFYVFEESFMYSLKKHTPGKNGFNSKTEKAWHRLFWVIVNKLTEGIDLEEKDNCLDQINKDNNKYQ